MNKRNYAADGLRGLFALCVAVAHLSSWSGVDLPVFLQAIFSKTQLYFVIGFYIISGFCMYLVYHQKQFDFSYYKYFMLRRFLRIAPLFYLLCCLGLAFKYFTGAADWDFIIEFFLNIFFLFGFYNPGVNSVLVGGWSIGIEFVFYFFFPVMLFLFRKNKWLLFAAALLIHLVFANYFIDSQIGVGEQWGLYTNFPMFLIYFVSGMLIAKFYVKNKLSNAKNVALFLSALGLFLAFDFSHNFDIRLATGVTDFVLMLLINVLVFFAASTHLNDALQKIATFLGDISYSLYLGHYFVYFGVATILAKLLPAYDTPIIIFSISLPLVILLSHASYHLYEKRFLRIGRKK